MVKINPFNAYSTVISTPNISPSDLSDIFHRGLYKLIFSISKWFNNI